MEDSDLPRSKSKSNFVALDETPNNNNEQSAGSTQIEHEELTSTIGKNIIRRGYLERLGIIVLLSNF
jgi:hypothetical protein